MRLAHLSGVQNKHNQVGGTLKSIRRRPLIVHLNKYPMEDMGKSVGVVLP